MTSYPAKLFLIGEYSVLLGSEALAFPLNSKTLEWVYSKAAPAFDFNSFIAFLNRHEALSGMLDLEQLNEDISNHFIPDINIPLAYGMGSSGALCASILHRYSMDSNLRVEKIHEILILMESYFHGHSSGLDPLISFYNCPIHLRSNGEYKFLHSSYKNQLKNYPLYLLDSGKQRNTHEYVAIFKDKIINSAYKSRIQNELIPLNDAIIRSFLSNDTKKFIELWKSISQLSFLLFDEMIPEPLKSIWAEGLKSGAYYLKLCGAGGGGYFLVLPIQEKKFAKKIQLASIPILSCS
ncbi:MAG: hypothetical protein M3Q56_00960 [Bacteroidota bacterium]|nr:hypothetical protein [Bacteroidota bacterium]